MEDSKTVTVTTPSGEEATRTKRRVAEMLEEALPGRLPWSIAPASVTGLTNLLYGVQCPRWTMQPVTCLLRPYPEDTTEADRLSATQEFIPSPLESGKFRPTTIAPIMH